MNKFSYIYYKTNQQLDRLAVYIADLVMYRDKRRDFTKKSLQFFFVISFLLIFSQLTFSFEANRKDFSSDLVFHKAKIESDFDSVKDIYEKNYFNSYPSLFHNIFGSYMVLQGITFSHFLHQYIFALIPSIFFVITGNISSLIVLFSTYSLFYSFENGVLVQVLEVVFSVAFLRSRKIGMRELILIYFMYKIHNYGWLLISFLIFLKFFIFDVKIPKSILHLGIYLVSLYNPFVTPFLLIPSFLLQAEKETKLSYLSFRILTIIISKILGNPMIGDRLDVFSGFIFASGFRSLGKFEKVICLVSFLLMIYVGFHKATLI